MGVGDVLLFVMQGLINGQVWQNTHFYRVTAATGVMEEGQFIEVVQAWIDWYADDVHPSLADLCSVNMSWTGAKGYNLFEPAAVGEAAYAPPLIGAVSGNVLAQFNSWGFTQPSGRRGMNSGKRRVPGPTESTVGDFGLRDPALDGLAAAVADAFSDDVILLYDEDAKNVTLRPVIVKRVREGAGTPADPYTYRLPVSTSELIYYNATSWLADEYITTQNSRKTGRGI